MNIGVIREKNPGERRVALTPPAVRDLVERGNAVWVEAGAGESAMFLDESYARGGASIAYSAAEVIRRCELVVKISVPRLAEIEVCHSGTAMMAFYHLAVAEPSLFRKLVEREVTAVGYEIIQTDDGRLPVLAAVSEIAGQMTVPLAAHLLRTSSGGPGILLGGSSGVAPAHVVVLGAGVVGTWAARTATASGARVTVFDIDTEKLRRLREHLPNVATGLADPESIGTALASADVVIGAVLVAGSKTPHLVTRQMARSMKPGSVIIDAAIDQGGCFETSRPTTINDPTFVAEGVTHYCVPNLTADMSRTSSTAIAQSVLPYLIRMASGGIDHALLECPALARGVYTYHGECINDQLAQACNVKARSIPELLSGAADRGAANSCASG